VLREYVEAMRALWTQDEASYDGEFVTFGAAWAWPKPVQSHVPVLIGAGGGPKTFAWIAANADGWMTTPTENDVAGHAAALRDAWREAGRGGAPEIAVLVVSKPTPEDFAAWEAAGVTELIWGLPDRSAEEVEAFIARHGERLGLG
jgi:alkanesulfonate monooxygenase SsuD/methylene tetrahydromethanopterin reductase-like flavin-dependent oxidoreductase (luciferase family)